MLVSKAIAFNAIFDTSCSLISSQIRITSPEGKFLFGKVNVFAVAWSIIYTARFEVESRSSKS